MFPRLKFVASSFAAAVSLCLLTPSQAAAQCAPACAVGTAAQLQTALSNAVNGDTITFTNNITLTGNLSAISTNVTIDGGGYTLSGNDQYRGLYFGWQGSGGPAITATLQNLTIANTLAAGGAGGSGSGGGGGGAGIGGALFVDDGAFVQVSNVSLASNAAVGGAGGAGGLVGGVNAGGGGGLVAAGAAGSTGTGGDGGGFISGPGGTGGFIGNNGGFGGGGGGGSPFGTGGSGGFGAGGGAGGNGGAGGYGGGGAGGGSFYFNAGAAGLLGGAANGATGDGGGGAALGGAIFVSQAGGLQVSGNFSVNGSSVTAGAGAGAAGAGSAAGAGIFIAGSGSLIMQPAAGQTVSIQSSISDEFGTTGTGGSASLLHIGAGTLVLGGNNTYTGTTFVSGGTLSISSDANLGKGNSANYVAMSGGTLAITATNTFAHSVLMFGNATFNVSPGKVASWTGQIAESSSSALNVTGGGTLALLNSTNVFSNGVFVNGGSTVAVDSDRELGLTSGSITIGDNTSAGTLQINSPAFSSNRTIELGAGGATIDTVGGTNATLSGTVEGAGGLTKAGSGTLILSGSVGYAGPTVIAGGTLRAGNKNLFLPGSSLSVGSGSTIDFGGFSQQLEAVSGSGTLALGGGTLTLGNGGTSSTFGGTISGSGGLVKNGGGTFTFLGTGAYTGGTTVNGGALVSNTGSLLGPILNNATVIFDQTGSGTFAGNISGAGGFGKTGGGAVTLTGVNTYTGGTVVAGGTLIGTTTSLQGTIVDNAVVTIAQDTDATFNGSLQGTGLFSKSGLGTLTLNGTHPFTGTASVDQGTLALNGALGGNINVGAQGTLVASGLVNGSATISGNVIVPQLGSQAASFATSRFHTMATSTQPAPQFVVNGDFNALAGSNLTFTVTPNGVAPIFVNGRATLQGTNFNVTVNDPNPARYSTYTALTAVQGVTAAGLTVTDSGAIVPVLKVEANDVLVTLLNYNIPLSSVVTGGNATNVAKAVDKLKTGAVGDFAFVAHELTALNDSQLSTALQSLSGEVHASQVRVAATDSQSLTDLVRSTISDREDDAQSNKQAGASGATHHTKAAAMWFQVAADHATMADGTVANTGGGVGGYDIRQTENFTAGAGVSFTQGTMTLGDGGGVSQMKAPRAFGYTGVGIGRFKLHVGGSAARTSNNTSRDIAFQATVPNASGQQVPLTGTTRTGGPRLVAFDAATGTMQMATATDTGVDRTAQSNQTGVASDGWTEIKTSHKVKNWNFDYKSSVRTSRVSTNAFTETGAGAISLQGGDQVVTIKEADVNMAGAKKSGKWRPNFLVEYRKEFAPTLTTANLNFVGQPQASFETDGVPIPQTEYKGVAGITMRGTWLEYTIQYHFSKLQGEKHQALSVSMRFK